MPSATSWWSPDRPPGPPSGCDSNSTIFGLPGPWHCHTIVQYSGAQSRTIIGRCPHWATFSRLSAREGTVAWMALNSRVSAPWPLARLRDAMPPLGGPLLVAVAYFLGAEAAFLIG